MRKIKITGKMYTLRQLSVSGGSTVTNQFYGNATPEAVVMTF
jgi:hypothetical protein